MILIKDRHEVELELWKLVVLGKYDTYKGSTLFGSWFFRSRGRGGNMILIKDYVFGVICF